MKKIITASLIAGLLLMPVTAMPPHKSRTTSPAAPIPVGCAMAVCVVVIGGIAIYCIVRLCKKLPDPKTNNPPPEVRSPRVITTNRVAAAAAALDTADTGENVLRVEEKETLASVWGESYTIRHLSDWTAVLMKDGQPLATNLPSWHFNATNNEWYAYYDFGTLPKPEQSSRFFRLLSVQ